MKQSQVKPGVVAMLSLGKRGAVRVEVRYQFTPERAGDVRWSVVDSSGQHRVATPRQLRPMPRGFGLIEAVDHEAMLRMLSAEKGQTIDAGDVVIETTLHRLEPASRWKGGDCSCSRGGSAVFCECRD